MSETPQNPDRPADAPTTVSTTPREDAAPRPAYAHESHTHKPSRLNLAAAWVGIVAGAVVIVAVIFGTGVMVGKHSGGGRDGGGRHHEMMFERGGPFAQFDRPGGGGPRFQSPQPPQNANPWAPTAPTPARP